MPSATRAVSAILMAILGAMAALQYQPLVHEDTILPYFPYLAATLAALIGWISVGRRIERGKYGALSAGLTGAGLFAFWFVFFQVFYRLIRFALWKRFRRQGDAVDGFVDWMIEYALWLLTPEVLVVFLGGGIAVGLLASAAHKYFK